MDDLFRFMAIRPAQTPDTSNVVSLSSDSPFEVEARRHLSGGGAAPAEVRSVVKDLAQTYAPTAILIRDPTSAPLCVNASALRQALVALDPTSAADPGVAAKVSNVFGMKAAKLLQDATFQKDRDQLFDTIVLTYLLPSLHALPLSHLVAVAQVVGLINRVAAGDATLTTVAAVQAALNGTVVLPANLFPADPARIQPVGVADLKVVKQHIKAYNLGEMSSIENILQGEVRARTSTHYVKSKRSTTTDQQSSTDTETELDTTERFELQRETDNAQKEDISAKGGVSATYKYGDSLTINANVDASYASSKDTSTKQSQSYAKEVTSRAISKVTSSFRQTITTSLLESQRDHEKHDFDNSKGDGNISGIYQWVNEVYEAQVFNYGKRLLFDFVVPEPAAFLIDGATMAAATPNPSNPVAPAALTKGTPPTPLTPADISTDTNSVTYFGVLLARYQVSNAKGPTAPTISVNKSIAATTGDPQGGDITIPAGYVATEVTVNGLYNYSDPGSTGLNVYVGAQHFGLNAQGAPAVTLPANGEVNSIAYGVGTDRVQNFVVSIDIACSQDPSAFIQWQLDTFNAIVAGYTTLLGAYQDALANQIPSTSAIGALGGNPSLNLILAQQEIKRSAIALLSGVDLLGAFNGIEEALPPVPSVDPGSAGHPGLFPRPNPATAEDQGAIIRFFEQAFEWEQLSYYCYPYYWGRKWTWYSRSTLQHADPIFQQFLSAGAARVVIPVRPTFENDIRYFLSTGQIWSGGTMPSLTDSDYLPITEEIKDAEDTIGDAIPDGDPWEFELPTSLIKLRKDNTLPAWIVDDDWNWTADPPDD